MNVMDDLAFFFYQKQKTTTASHGSDSMSFRKLFFYFIFCLRTFSADFGAFAVNFLFLNINLNLSKGGNIGMAAGSSRSGSAAANFTNSAHIFMKHRTCSM